jgi:lipopolysaccharide export LptBFGC system permease protein LptF
MRKLLPLAILFICFFCVNHISAQSKSSVISTQDIGTLKGIYLKNLSSNKVSEYGVHVIYKNQQFVYKQEQDTIHLKSKEQIAQFVTDIKAGLLVINDEEKEFNIANSNYILFKNKGYSDNNFIVIANKDQTIKTPINKFFANQLISWLNSIDFGKG